MNHLETFAMAKAANVGAVREIVRIATRDRPKLINYISTLGVFNSSATGAGRTINERSSIADERHHASSGYLASKWVGEQILLTARARAIPCNIFRLGLVWADAAAGRFDPLQHVYRLLKSCLLCGYGIKDYRYEMAPTPVDYVARSVVYLGSRHTDGQGIFHISSPGQLTDGVFERCNELMGMSLELLPYFEWIGKLRQLHQEGRSLPIVPLLEYTFSMDRESFDDHVRGNLLTRINFDCTRTYGELESAGIVAPALNDDLLRVCIEGMLARDADLATPPHWNSA
jgi:thioester reductase-like protein